MWRGRSAGGAGQSLRHDLRAFPPSSADLSTSRNLFKTAESAVCSSFHDTLAHSSNINSKCSAGNQSSELQAIEGLLIASTVSYANAAAKGPKQSPSEVIATTILLIPPCPLARSLTPLTSTPIQAAAPPLPEVVPNESASTSSLIDVDMPSVHTVPSEFVEQDVKTETQANRLEREAEAVKAKAERARKNAAAEAKKADSWITKQVSQLSDGTASGLALANLAAFVGVGSYLGYQGWNLYQKGSLDGKAVGLSVGILTAAGAAHAVVGSYLYRGKKN
ncbi:hypothetical protein MY11210_004977 [Beauveria gryllotalpidicola]